MKRILTKGVLVMLMALLTCATTVLRAASDSGLTRYTNLTVADGMSTSSYVPIYGLWMDDPEKSQTIYPAELLTSMVGESIASLTYYASNANVSWTSPVTVSLGITAQSSLPTTWATDPVTDVFTGNVAVQENQLIIEFSTPYTYTGGNLLIQFTNPDGGNYSSCSFYGTSATAASRNAYGSSVSGSGTVQNFMPKVTFAYGAPPTCPRPNALTASNITAYEATLSWADLSDASSWVIEYGEQGFTLGEGTIVTADANPFTIEGLMPVTTYQCYVKAICSEEDESDYSQPHTFTTICASYLLPFFQDFSDATFPPACWNRYSGLASAAFAGINPTPTTVTTSWNRVTTDYGIGGPHARLNIYGTTCKYWLVTPNIDLSEPSTLMFDALFTDCGTANAPDGIGDDDQFMVIISTDGGNTWLEENATVWDANGLAELSGGVTPITIDLAAYTGFEICIAFYGESTVYDYDNDLRIKNVYVGPAISCERPMNVVMNSLSAYEAEISWEEMGNAIEWNVVVSTTPLADPNAAEPMVVYENPCTISNLQPTTTYYVYVQSVCEDGNSLWASVLSFTTPCATYQTPFLEDFSATTFPPNCWSRMTGLASAAFAGTAPTTSAGGWVRNTSNYGIEGPHVKVNIYGTACRYWLVTPNINIAEGDFLSFDAAFTDYANASEPEGVDGDDKFMVIISTDGGATWTEDNATIWEGEMLYEIAYTATPISIDLADYVGQDIQIAFYAESTASGADNDFHVGNIYVGQEITCVRPSGITFSNIYGYGADVSWVENGVASEWNIVVSTTPLTNPGEGEVMVAYEPTFSIEGLTPSTAYYLYIQANCDDATSVWTSAATFMTTVSCPVVTNVTSNSFAYAANIEWQQGGEVASWVVEYAVNSLGSGETQTVEVFEPYCELEELLPNTTYQYRIKTICGEEDESSWSPNYSFTTQCASYMAPFYQDFSETTFPPACWTMYSGTAANAFAGTNPTQQSYTSWIRYTGSNGLSGPHAKVNIYSSAHSYWLVTPNITLTEGCSLTFEAALTDYNTNNEPDVIGEDDKFMVIISTDGGATWLEENATVWEGEGMREISNEPTLITIDLDGYSGDIMIAFYSESLVNDEADNDLHVGNIYVGPQITCERPSNVVLNSLSGNAAEIEWAENGMATEWNLVVSTTPLSNPADGEIIQVYENPYLITDLQPVTTYYVYVQANCGDEVSLWSGVYQFTTPCATYNTPFFQDFSGTTFPPECWSRYSGLASAAFAGTAPTSYNGGWLRITNNNGIEGPHTKVNIYGTGCKYWLVTPAISIAEGDVLNFDAAMTAYGNANASSTISDDDTFMVIISLDGGATWLEENATVWDAVALRQMSNLASPMVVDLADYADMDINIAFYAESTVSGGDNDFHVGNIYVGPAITCVKPSSLAVSNISGFGADLTWVENGFSTEWNIAVSPVALSDPSMVESISAYENPFTLSGLTPQTQYYVYVQAVCEDGNSPWSNPCTFATTVSCPAPSEIDFEVSATEILISWNENGYEQLGWELEWGTFGFTQGEGTVVEVEESAYLLEDLTPATTYSFYLRALCGEGDFSTWSGPFNCSTLVECPEGSTPLSGTIGNGTLTGYNFPINTFFKHSYVQEIFTADELADEGLTSGIINTFGFQYIHQTPITKNNITIYMANVDQETFVSGGWIPEQDLTQVYAGALTIDNSGADNWYEILLQTGFEYDGVSNLVVAVLNNQGSYENSEARFKHHVTEGVYRTLYYCVDGTSTITFNEAGMPQTGSAVAGTTSSNRNNMRFNMCAVPLACPRPTGLTITNIAGHEADITWVENGDATTWNLVISTEAVDPATVTPIVVTDAPTYAATNLLAETPYFVYIQAVCDADESSVWSNAYTFTTTISCPAATNLAAVTTGTTAELSWVSVGTTLGWVIEYGNAGFTHGNGTTVQLTEPNYTIIDLTPSSNYAFYVKTICAEEDESDWSDVCNFSTQCVGATELPYFENFNAYTGTTYNTAGDVPNCWESYTTNTSYPAPHIVASGTYWYSPDQTNSLIFTTGASGSDAIVVLPELDGDLNAMSISFWYKQESSSIGVLSLGYVTTNGENALNTFVSIVALPQQSTGTEFATSLAGSNIPAGAYLALKWTYNSSFYSCCIDDLLVTDEAGPDVCSAPANLQSNIDYEAQVATLTWDEIPAAIGYNVFFNGTNVTNFVSSMINGSTLTAPFSLFTTLPADEYCITLQTICANGVSPMSEELCITIEEPTPCEAPTLAGELVTMGGDLAIYLTWSEVPTATSYRIYYEGTLINESNTTSGYVNGVEAGNTYCFTATAVCPNGESDPSNEVCITIDAPEPCDPPTLTAEASEYNGEPAIYISWTVVEGATSYRIYEGTELLGETADNSGYLTGVEYGVEYCFTVTAVCAAGESDPSNEACVTIDEPSQPCEAPVLLAEESEYNGEAAVYMMWNAIEGATGYNIYYGTSLLGNTPETSVYITGLEAGQTYCFNVTAVCAAGESDPSNEACVTMSEEPEPCVAPTNLVVTAAGTTAQLVWDAVEGAIGYKVFEGTTELAAVTTNSFNHEGLDINTTYCYTVKTLCANGESEASEEACVTINAINELDNAYSVYPNPASAKVFVKGEHIKSIAVYNFLGQLVDNYTDLVGTEQEINTNAYENGVYMLRITTTNGDVVSKRVVIAR